MKMLYDAFLGCGKCVATDSRRVERGSMFFALRGGNFDGNDYAARALASGAAVAVVDRAEVATDERYIVVDDVLETLQQLAAHHRRVIGIKILAITGTNGKTTTKELASAVLSRRYKVAATQGNLNNHIGVPLTLLAMREGDLGVVEMGASAVGEVAKLCEIAGPDYGIITNVGRAHLEGFGGFEGVKRGKGELYDYLAAHGGTAFVSGADKALTDMAADRKGLRTIEYDEVDLKSSLAGDYNRHNIAAAAAIGREFGILEADIAAAIAEYEPTNNRSQRVVVGDNILIVDCYNANPSSMRAALESFSGDTVILGDMAELGDFAAAEHEAIVAMLSDYDAYLVGENFTQAAVSRNLRTFSDTSALLDFLHQNPLHDRTILVKGSRAMGLEKIYLSLQDEQ